ncbi:10267_t:CDS:2, partial [Racocetra persica]
CMEEEDYFLGTNCLVHYTPPPSYQTFQSASLFPLPSRKISSRW